MAARRRSVKEHMKEVTRTPMRARRIPYLKTSFFQNIIELSGPEVVVAPADDVVDAV
jgi:hypothetical protein